MNEPDPPIAMPAFPDDPPTAIPPAPGPYKMQPYMNSWAVVDGNGNPVAYVAETNADGTTARPSLELMASGRLLAAARLMRKTLLQDRWLVETLRDACPDENLKALAMDQIKRIDLVLATAYLSK